MIFTWKPLCSGFVWLKSQSWKCQLAIAENAVFPIPKRSLLTNGVRVEQLDKLNYAKKTQTKRYTTESFEIALGARSFSFLVCSKQFKALQSFKISKKAKNWAKKQWSRFMMESIFLMIAILTYEWDLA